MLRRKRQPMPDFVRNALIKNNLIKDYENRPEYQRNDYIGWITRAKQETTQHKRLYQMLDELETGGVYMNMAHNPSRKTKG